MYDIFVLYKDLNVFVFNVVLVVIFVNVIFWMVVFKICCIYGFFGFGDILMFEGIKILYLVEWKVIYNSSCSGVWLDGFWLEWVCILGGGGGFYLLNVLDYGYLNGGINFIGELFIIFGCDCFDLGGFVCLMIVCFGDMWKVGQLKFGDMVCFEFVLFENSFEILFRKIVYFQVLVVRVRGEKNEILFLDVDVVLVVLFLFLCEIFLLGICFYIVYCLGGDDGIIVEFGL